MTFLIGLFIGIAIFLIAFVLLVFYAIICVGSKSEDQMMKHFNARQRELEILRKQPPLN